MGILSQNWGVVMKFDCVILNPPYSNSVGGANGGATELYSPFINIAYTLSKDLVVPIIPAKWYVNARGSGINDFRKDFLTCKNIKEIHDFENEKDIFPEIDLRGGICYYLYKKGYNSSICDFYSNSIMRKRDLSRNNILIRNELFEKLVESVDKKTSLTSIVSVTAPFGLITDVFDDFSKYELPSMCEVGYADCVTVYGSLGRKMYCNKDYPFPTKCDNLAKYKIFIPCADSGMDFTRLKLKPFIGKPYEACTGTYLTIGSFNKLVEAESCLSYINTKLVHALIFARKVNQHMSRDIYSFVPLVDFNKIYTDLYLKDLWGIPDTVFSDIMNYIKN